jgi:hypothetical protein
MNLLYTTAGNFQTLESQDNVRVWRSRYHIVELMPIERVASYLHFDPSSALALIDAIICSADTDLFTYGSDMHALELNFPLEQALKLARDVRDLPQNCAMRDGRKWRSIPFIIFRHIADYWTALEAQEDTHANIIFTPYSHPIVALDQIQGIVDGYQERVLDDYRNLGILVRFENGHAQIRPALRKKDPNAESEYYYAPADRRRNKDWVTVKRDDQGLRHDVELFYQLIDTNASETQMHLFFEQHPAFLMEARMGIPISHSPNFVVPKDWKPDFAFSPILGPQDDRMIELLELKGPSEKTLTRGIHRGFSAKVKSAIDQVRDYDHYLRDPANIQAVLRAFGYLPDSSKLAVLIGRTPGNEVDSKIFMQRQGQIDVKVITYDEILQTQANQIRPLLLPGWARSTTLAPTY